MSTATAAVQTADFGIVGLDVMGQNLALNVGDHHHSVAVRSLEGDGVDRFVQSHGQRHLVGTKTLHDFTRALAPPRRILMMTKAGDPVDQMLGIPMPAMLAALSYYDSYRSAQLPQNLTQAQRDFFGAHTYQRADRPQAGFVHTDWLSLLEDKKKGGQK